MQDGDGFSSAVISVRIVHIDHYQHPLRDYSSSVSFQAARLTHAHAHAVPKLPVIRIFGSTPAGQSCCLHIHGLRPYLYLPLPPFVPPDAAFRHAAALRNALEHCLRAAYADGPGGVGGGGAGGANGPHEGRPAAAGGGAGEAADDVRYIAEIEPVLKTDIYGYHPAPRVFLKIHTYNPRSVARIAMIVAQRALPAELCPPGTAPYEAHIPFHMQFLVDHSLSGMAYLNLSDFRFRPPLPNNPQPKRTALQLFSRRSADRLFVRGLESHRSDLFWPFHVAKRSTCPLELDSFPQHIIDARPQPVDESDEYAFVSRTLRVLWEEERLRIGKYPPRQKPGERKVKAGAALSEDFLREKLADVLHADQPGSEDARENAVAAQEARDELASFQASQARSTQSSFLPSSYDDVLGVLDATGSFATPKEEEDEDGEIIIEDFDDDDYGDDFGAVGGGDIEQSRFGPHQLPHLNENRDLIGKAWADIADCTQHVHNSSGGEKQDDLQPRKLSADDTVDPQICVEDRLDNATQQKSTETPRAIGRASEDSHHSHDEIDDDLTLSDYLGNLELQQSQSMEGTDIVAANNEEHSLLDSDVGFTNAVLAQPQDEAPSVENVFTHQIVVHPAERPPSCASLLAGKKLGDAFSILYPTPFYGEREDEVHGKHSFGGMIIPVRKSGAEGFEPFPSHFDGGGTTVEIMPTVVRPTERPPSLSSLKAAFNDEKNVFKRGGSRNARVHIDSAGRQIYLRSDSGVRDPVSFSHNPVDDFLPPRTNNEDVSNMFDNPESSDDSEHAPAQIGASGRASTQDTDDTIVQNRPLSPKYDEGYQLFVLPSKQPLTETPRMRRSVFESYKRMNSDSSKYNRNSTVSLSESMHRYQNLTVMSLEVLAECYSDKLPDPSQNAILAICAVSKRDCEGSEESKIKSAIFVTSKSRFSRVEDLEVLSYESEMQLLDALAAHIRQDDPDVLVGFETQNASIGYVLERAHTVGHSFSQASSRWLKGSGLDGNQRPAATEMSAAAAYYQRKGANIKITGRHVLSLWRIVRKEVKLPAYSRETVASELFQMTFPRHRNAELESWLSSSRTSARAVRHLKRQTTLNIAILDKLAILPRTGELARVFGIDFISVQTRGSQFRVESMLARVARTRDFVLLAAPREEVFLQPAVEALPLVMEPQSALYVDPVIVLDFQSLYPSVVIAHNLCYSTILGNLNRLSTWSEKRRLGVVPDYVAPAKEALGGVPLEHVFISSGGEMFVDASIRRGILPQLLKDILETRVMVKKAMRSVVGDDSIAGLMNARQFGLKMIANVTYGYTGASFSGRMPCAGLADAIVQCGRDALEETVRYVEEELKEETGATVVYGDTDSLFVKCPGASRDEAFDIGERIVARAAEMFPDPITLKLEKVYQPCIMQTKKRYVGYSYESRDQAVPIFDAKGIETVRRDSCPLVQKALEKSIRVLFETKDVSAVKKYIQRLCQKLFLDRVPFSDYIFRKEVRLGSYKEGHLPPAAIVSTKAIERDPRAAPRHGERVPFVVLYDRPGAPLKDCVVAPEEYLAAARRGLARLNTTYYITKQILPSLDRIFSLVGVRVSSWYAEMPRPHFDPIVPLSNHEKKSMRSKQSSLFMFYTTEKCVVCHGKGVEQQVCGNCLADENGAQAARFLLEMRAREQEKNDASLARECLRCISERGVGPAGVLCTNLMCSISDERAAAKRKVATLRHILDDSGTWNT